MKEGSRGRGKDGPKTRPFLLGEAECSYYSCLYRRALITRVLVLRVFRVGVPGLC